MPSEIEPTSLADLVADAADVRRVLDPHIRVIELPARTSMVISDDAFALVAGLDSYGD